MTDFDNNDMEREPALASETLARLYEEQGNVDRASAIREKLMQPGNWKIAVDPDQPKTGTGDTVVLEQAEGHTLQCRWAMTHEAMQIVKGRFPATLKERSKALTAVLRVVLLRPAGPVPQREYLDLDIPNMSGACAILGLETGPAWVCAAVGLRHPSGRFHSTAHSDVLPLAQI